MIGLIVGAVLPLFKEGLGFAKGWQDNKQELSLLTKQAEIQAQIGSSKLQEMHVNASVREMESVRNHDAVIQRRASIWVVNVNGLIRPLTTFLAMGLLGYGLLLGSPELLKSSAWLFFMEISSGIIAFWFSDRSIGKMKAGK